MLEAALVNKNSPNMSISDGRDNENSSSKPTGWLDYSSAKIYEKKANGIP